MEKMFLGYLIGKETTLILTDGKQEKGILTDVQEEKILIAGKEIAEKEIEFVLY